MQIWQTESSSLEATLRLGEQVGQNLRGGEVIELISDLGGGKTSFVRGLAIGLRSEDTVHSPSFTISNQYKSDIFTLHHLDFYRLNETGTMKEVLTEILSEPSNIVVVEWAGIIKNVLPNERLRIRITPTSETSRTFEFAYPDELDYLLPRDT